MCILGVYTGRETAEVFQLRHLKKHKSHFMPTGSIGKKKRHTRPTKGWNEVLGYHTQRIYKGYSSLLFATWIARNFIPVTKMLTIRKKFSRIR